MKPDVFFLALTPCRDRPRISSASTGRSLISILLLGILVLPVDAVVKPPALSKPFSVIPLRQEISGVRPLDLRHTHWSQIADRYGLDPYVLYAVALTESARIRNDFAQPWVWALNREGKSLYPESAAEALHQIRHQLKAGNRNIDIGLMQVNLRWHRHRVGRIEDLLDPATNLELGAQILQEAIATVPDDPILGVGRYHAWSNPSEARKYGHRVLRLAVQLRSMAKQGG